MYPYQIEIYVQNCWRDSWYLATERLLWISEFWKARFWKRIIQAATTQLQNENIEDVKFDKIIAKLRNSLNDTTKFYRSPDSLFYNTIRHLSISFLFGLPKLNVGQSAFLSIIWSPWLLLCKMYLLCYTDFWERYGSQKFFDWLILPRSSSSNHGFKRSVYEVRTRVTYLHHCHTPCKMPGMSNGSILLLYHLPSGRVQEKAKSYMLKSYDSWGNCKSTRRKVYKMLRKSIGWKVGAKVYIADKEAHYLVVTDTRRYTHEHLVAI